jgi:hypothetical protein
MTVMTKKKHTLRRLFIDIRMSSDWFTLKQFSDERFRNDIIDNTEVISYSLNLSRYMDVVMLMSADRLNQVLSEHDCENKIELFYSKNRKYHGWCIVLECEKAIVPLVSTIFDWDRVETIDRSITVKELMEQGWR